MPDFLSFKLPWQRDGRKVHVPDQMVTSDARTGEAGVIRFDRFRLEVQPGLGVPGEETDAIAAAIQSLPDLRRQHDEAEEACGLALAFAEKSGHLNDCCAEYDEDLGRWVTLPDDQCWCGRTALIAKLQRFATLPTGAAAGEDVR